MQGLDLLGTDGVGAGRNRVFSFTGQGWSERPGRGRVGQVPADGAEEPGSGRLGNESLLLGGQELAGDGQEVIYVEGFLHEVIDAQG